MTRFGYPLISYVLWQAFYLFVTECVCRRHIAQNRDVLTSMRWLSADRKNGFNKFCKMVCRKLGVFKPNEEFDGDTTKTKIVFITAQFIYTVLTYIPVKFCYESYIFHVSFLLLTMLKCVWNGASFYIEVFAVRYVRKFKRNPDSSSNGTSPSNSADNTPTSSPHVSPAETNPSISTIPDVSLSKKNH